MGVGRFAGDGGEARGRPADGLLDAPLLQLLLVATHVAADHVGHRRARCATTIQALLIAGSLSSYPHLYSGNSLVC
eukprot:1187783-Prorocentrum_minimum.AAC.1